MHEDYASFSLFEVPDAMTSEQFADFLQKGAPKKEAAQDVKKDEL